MTYLYSPHGAATKDFELFGVNQMKLLNIKLGENSSIKFNYTSVSTVMELKVYMKMTYKILFDMQVL